MGSGAKKLDFGQLGLKGLSNHKPRNQLQFSETGPHFIQNYKLNPIKSSNQKKNIDIGVWAQEIRFGPVGLERFIKP